MPLIHLRVLLVITTVSIALLASILSDVTARQATADLLSRLFGLLGVKTASLQTTSLQPSTTTSILPLSNMASPVAANGGAASTNGTAPSKRPPVYFISHGGPMTMYDTAHPVYAQLQSIGREILEEVKPKGIVVFSAHWQSDFVEGVEVSVPENEGEIEMAKSGRGLLFDFYGFPTSYYAEKFPHLLSPALSSHILTQLNDQFRTTGIAARATSRPLDHGVFVPFKVMFGPAGLASSGIPLASVSLLSNAGDAAGHIRLGRAMEKLRDEGICVVVSGMAVHNLRDAMRLGRMGLKGGGGLPYAESFEEGLREAVEQTPGKARDEAMVGLLARADARKAHPSWEHLVPVHVGVGAAGEDWGRRLWTMAEGGMGWSQFRFG